MNKKELKILATEEHRLYLALQYAKKSAKHFYIIAVKYRKQGNNTQAKHYWGYCKNACKDVENALTAWDAIYTLKNMLDLPIEKYTQARDEKALAERQWLADSAFDDIKGYVPFTFIRLVEKSAKIN